MGGLFAVWVQDGNLMVLTANPFDAKRHRPVSGPTEPEVPDASTIPAA